MGAQHRIDDERRATPERLERAARMGPDHRRQFNQGNGLAHRVKKDFLRGFLCDGFRLNLARFMTSLCSASSAEKVQKLTNTVSDFRFIRFTAKKYLVLR